MAKTKSKRIEIDSVDLDGEKKKYTFNFQAQKKISRHSLRTIELLKKRFNQEQS